MAARWASFHRAPQPDAVSATSPAIATATFGERRWIVHTIIVQSGRYRVVVWSTGDVGSNASSLELRVSTPVQVFG